MFAKRNKSNIWPMGNHDVFSDPAANKKNVVQRSSEPNPSTLTIRRGVQQDRTENRVGPGAHTGRTIKKIRFDLKLRAISPVNCVFIFYLCRRARGRSPRISDKLNFFFCQHYAPPSSPINPASTRRGAITTID